MNQKKYTKRNLRLYALNVVVQTYIKLRGFGMNILVQSVDGAFGVK